VGVIAIIIVKVSEYYFLTKGLFRTVILYCCISRWIYWAGNSFVLNGKNCLTMCKDIYVAYGAYHIYLPINHEK